MTKFLKNVDVTGYVSQTSVTSSLVKTDANGKLVAAVAGTDYNAPNVTSVAGTLIREIRNTTGATLTKGTIVYISGATGNKPTVSKALATGDSTSAQTFGLCQTDIANNSNGNVVVVGDITGLDTSSFTEGAQLYLSSTTAGTYTTTKQLAPAHLVYIGVVTRAHPTHGQIEVKIQNGYELDEIHDVAISSLANNHTLVWESATSLWKNKTIAAALGYTPMPTITFNTPLYVVSGGEVRIYQSSSTQNGYLSSTDWNTFNDKLSTSAAASTYLPLAGGTLTGALGGTSATFSGSVVVASPFTIKATNPYIQWKNALDTRLGYIQHATNLVMAADSGSIILNTTSGTFTLESGGAATFSSSVTAGQFIASGSSTVALFTSTGTTDWGTKIIGSSGGARTTLIVAQSGYSNGFTVEYTGTAMQYLFRDGNTGISTTTFADPVFKLQVGNGSADTRALFNSNNAYAISIRNGSSSLWYIGVNAQTAANGLQFYSNEGGIAMTLTTTSQLRLNAYTSATSYTGTAAGYLAFDSSGNIITVAGVASTDNTKLPLAGGSLTGRLNLLNTDSVDFALYHGAALSGSARIYYSQPSNQLRIYATAITSDATTGIGSLALYNGTAYKIVLTEANVGSYALPLTGGTLTGKLQINADWGGTNPERFTIRGTYPSITLRSTEANNNWLIHNDGTLSFYSASGVDSDSWGRRMYINTSGVLYINDNIAIHAGNIGSYTAGAVAWANVSSGYRENYDLGFRPANNTGSYAGFRFASPANDADAGYLLVRGGADNDVYTQNGITIVADLGWLTLAQRTTAGKGIRFMTGVTASTRMEISNAGAITLSGAATSTVGDSNFVAQSNGNTAIWRGRILSKNSTSDKAAFLGTYGSIAGVFSHNNALDAWAALYVNNVDGSNGGNVYLPTNSYVAGNAILHTGNSPGVSGAKYQINDDWLRVNSDNRQFQFYGNTRTMIYRTDGTTNPHGGGAYAHIWYYGGDADSQRVFIVHTDGRLYSPYHGWLDSMSITGNAGSVGGVGIGSIVRKDITGQYLKPFYEYSSYIGNDAPSTLASQMGGGGLRVDFQNPGATGSWSHTLTWSGYNRYSMSQIGTNYNTTDAKLYYRQTNNHDDAWAGWKEFVFNSGTWSIDISGNSRGINTDFLSTGSTNISSGYSRVLRNENGSGGNGSYAPVLHLAASDTMWQIQGAYGGDTWLKWRSGYAGTWYTWHTIFHSGLGAYTYASNMNQQVRTSDGVTFQDIYVNGWFRNNNNNQGLYNQNNGTHFYSNGTGSWGITGSGGNVELQFRSNHQSTLRGYVYGDTSSNFGLLNDQGGWSVRCYPGASYGGYLTGIWRSGGKMGAEYFYSDGWLYSQGNAGWHNDTYNQGLRQSKGNTTYGNVVTEGENYNGYGGYVISHNYNTTYMQNSSGDHGFYQENGNGWTFFHHRGYNCAGIGTDATDPSYSLHIIKYGGSNTGWIIWSDRRIKENIRTIDSALDKVLALRGVYYNKIDDPNKERQVGYIAQEVMEVVPELVVYSEELDVYNMNYGPMVSMLTEAVKEHHAKTVAQQAEIDTLKEQVQTLLTHINNGI